MRPKTAGIARMALIALSVSLCLLAYFHFHLSPEANQDCGFCRIYSHIACHPPDAALTVFNSAVLAVICLPAQVRHTFLLSAVASARDPPAC